MANLLVARQTLNLTVPVGHVDKSDSAAVLAMAQVIEAMRDRNFAPAWIGLATRQSFPAIVVDIANQNRAAEQVGAVDGIDVPDADRALRAVDFKAWQFGIPDVETTLTPASAREGWSNGQTEGQINRLKTLKRGLYGRAGTQLLRARMLPLYLPIEHRV